MQALGVAGANSWSPSSTWPMLAGFTQSRSFSGAIALNTVFWSICASIGMSARMPCTAGSALSLAMRSRISASLVPAGSVWLK